MAAIGTPVNGFNPHSADTGDVNLALRPGVAEKVFHITAQHECRFNFALNSVKPAWPELALPVRTPTLVAAIIPTRMKLISLTRPEFGNRPFSIPDTETRIYRQTCAKLKTMDGLSGNSSTATKCGERVSVDTLA
ncbi:hypothetical protein LNQ52_24665 [Klebsiella pneumoniae subsp. pneumoniae]|nr:hypothetical protein [Klebsiella pneumoniae subsp. pneumoniae]